MSRYKGLFHFEFADDLTLVGTDEAILEEVAQSIKNEGPQYGLFVAPEKTESFKVEKGKSSTSVRLLGLFTGD